MEDDERVIVGEGGKSGLLFVERDRLRARMKNDGEEIDGDLTRVASVLVRACSPNLMVEVGVEGEERGSFGGIIFVGEMTVEGRFLRREIDGDFGRVVPATTSEDSLFFPFFDVLLVNKLLLDLPDFAEGAGLGARFPPPPVELPKGSAEVERERMFEID